MARVFAAACLLAAVSSVSAELAPSPVQFKARAASSSSALPTVTAKGNAFYAGDTRFYIRGVDYQPGGSSSASDPLANPTVCNRDIPYFQKLGINTIRVYTVDNSANHDTCMNALAAAGIYVALDVNTPLYSINRDDPAPSYNPTYLQSVFATMEVFSKYTNTLLFFNGNEVINMPNNTDTAPYVKAVGRDMKSYRTARGLRAIPIGYSAADVSSNRYETALYFNCGTDDQRSDFFAFNDYSWCDSSSTVYSTSQWAQKVQQYGNYTLPFFLSEYGCIQTTRTFDEVSHLYNEMTSVYSGGLVYEYSQEGNGYGLVTISGSNVTTNADFGNLQKQFAASTPPSGSGGARTDASAAADCPAVSDEWELSAFPGAALPATPDGATQYFKNGAGTGPGLSGKGSQNAGGASTATASPGSGTSVASSAATTSSKGAANGLHPAPVSFGVLGSLAVVFVSMVVGMTLV